MTVVFREMKALMIKIKEKWELGHTGYFNWNLLSQIYLTECFNTPSGVHLRKQTNKKTQMTIQKKQSGFLQGQLTDPALS